MPSVLDLFGELGLKTDSFDRSLKGSVAQMKAADAQLDKVISGSNKLGDTSATVARRYEKLTEGITRQKQRLIEAAGAFERGDINAKKFQSTVDSVSRSVDGLNSRIKDAKARVTELGDTGFTHFQNQIRGGVTGSQSNDLFKGLSGYQKTQLSFQANDIISGLAMGQSPLQILAQQGGQIVQIFQQGKMATEGMAAGAQATSAAMTEASAVTTVFGTSIVAIGAVLAVGVTTIAAAYKLSADIRKEAEARLKTEEAIVGAINKQILAASEFKKRLAGEAGERAFDRLLGGDNLSGLMQKRADIQQRLDDRSQQRLAAIREREEMNKRYGFGADTARKNIEEVGIESARDAKVRKAREDAISRLSARIEELNQPTESGADFIKGVQSRQLENLKKNIGEAVKEQQKAREAAKQTIEQQNKEETASIQNKYKVQEAALKLHLQTSAASQAESIVATSALQTRELNAQIASTRRYYDALIANARDATERQQAESNKRIAISNLEAQKQIEAIEKVRRLSAENLQQFDKYLSASNLRSEAGEFRQGFKNSANPEHAYLARFYAGVMGGGESTYNRLLEEYRVEGIQSDVARQLRAVTGGSALRANKDQQRALDQAIIRITSGHVGDLTEGQNALAAAARDREAREVENEVRDINKKLLRALESGSVVRIINEAKDKARVDRRPSRADAADHYEQ